MALSINGNTKIDPAWAWGVYKPDSDQPWSIKLAGHLFRRAGFGANWQQLQKALADGPKETIDILLRGGENTREFNDRYGEYETAAGGQSSEGISAWWLRRMIASPHPLLEKMTLFWHGYFGVSNERVKNSRLVCDHIRLLRKEALGSFRSMLKAIPYDPAVLLCVNSIANRKALPDEKLACVLLGEYTLGEGNFSKKDVSETARAFTGWFVLRGGLKYIDREHDENIKTILGKEGSFKGDDVIAILLGQADTARRLVSEVYRWFISETHEPSEQLIRPLVKEFAKDYDILKLVEKMLRSNLFFSSKAYRQRVKSPVEFAVGIARAMEGTVSTTQLARDVASLGHDLYNPPTVKGFPGGVYWISDTAMTGRNNLAAAMLRADGPYKDKLDPWQVARKYDFDTVGKAGVFLLDLLVQGDINENTDKVLLEQLRIAGLSGDPDVMLRRFAHSVVTLAEFNLG